MLALCRSRFFLSFTSICCCAELRC